LEWTFAQPDKIHYRSSGYRAVTVVSNGEQVHTVLPEALECIVSNAPATLTELPSLYYARSAVVGVTELKLLEGADPAALLEDIRLEPKDEKVAGVRCHVLTGELPESELRNIEGRRGRQRLWIGWDDSLIHQSLVQVQRVTEQDLIVGLPTARTEEIQQTDTLRVEVTEVTPNVALKDDAFDYTSPPGYRVVTDLRGKPFPDVSLPDLEGRPVSFQDYRGRDVILAFWSSWNPGSLTQLEVVQEFREAHPEESLVVVSATLDVDKSVAARALRDHEVTLPALRAGGDLERRIAALDVVSLPKIFLVDKDGIIRDVLSTQVSLPELVEIARDAGFEF
jgi:peroxiredoxin/outer membrane lipoprotein-sorting protein